jgi:hypothetical protein
MTEELSARQNQTFGWRIDRHVRGLLDDVETLEVNPHGMSRVSESSVRKSIASEQVAELVVGAGLRNAENRNEHNTNDNDAEADKHDCKASAPGHASKCALYYREGGRPTATRGFARGEQNKCGGGRHKKKFDKRQKPWRESGVEVEHGVVKPGFILSLMHNIELGTP